MNTEKRPNQENSQLIFSSKLHKDVASLYLNKEFSDVSFVVHGQKIHAHKVILAVRSSYFKTLLFGDFNEASKSQIALTDVSVNAFKKLLKYIYTGSMCIVPANLDLALEVLDLGHKYCMEDLETLIAETLAEMVDLDNVFKIIEKANVYNLSKLSDVCLNFIDGQVWELQKSQKLQNQSEEIVLQVINRETFRLPEIDVFKIVAQWCQNNRKKSNNLLKCIRFVDMTLEEIFSVVKPTKLVDNEVLMDAISKIGGITPKPPPFRRMPLSLPDVNVASLEYSAQLIISNSKKCNFVLSGNTNEGKFVSRVINMEDFVVKLGQLAYINNIQILLCTNLRQRSFRYYIEASLDGKTWKNIIDYRNYDCRGLQNLYFEKELLQFLKVVGTYSSEGDTIDIVSFEAQLKKTVPKLINGIVCPSANVALFTPQHAVIIEENGFREQRIYYNTPNDFVVQLAQPFMINRIKLCLNSYGSRDYCIEGSMNKSNWTVLVNANYYDFSRGLTFPAKPVTYIRIKRMQYSVAYDTFECNYVE